MKGVIAVILLGVSGFASAQTIYKCATAHGTVYSQQPCAAPGSDHMTAIELKRDHHSADPADIARAAAAEAQSDEDLRQRDLARDEAECIDAQVSATRVGTRRRINGLQAQIQEAEYSMGYSSNNLAGATRSQGLQERVAGLQSAISMQQQILAQTELTARKICAERRAAADQPTRGD